MTHDATKNAEPESEWADFLKFLVKLGLFFFILRSFIISPFNIPSESMQPRLLIGDYLFVSKWSYGYSRYSLPFNLPIIPGRILASQPEAGDVVVFKPAPSNKTDYIKRVIGLPGDVMEMRNGQVFINDEPVAKKRIADLVIPVTPNMTEPLMAGASPCYSLAFEEVTNGAQFCRYPQYRETLPNGRSYNVLDLIDGPRDTTAPVIVPEGHMFMMGDNRDNSMDSRFPAEENKGVGMVSQEFLVGKAMVSIFSTDGSANWLLPWTWFTAARWDRIGKTF